MCAFSVSFFGTTYHEHSPRMMTSIAGRWKKIGGGRSPCHSSDLSHLDMQGVASTRLTYLIHNPKLSDKNSEHTGSEETEEEWADKYVVV